MSLIKRKPLTEKKLAAIRQNQKLCHGTLTAEGRLRIRAAHLRHGFYAQAEEVALRSLGEEPAQFQQLLEGLWEEFNPSGSMQEGLVIRLARAMWLMNRADRMQEGYALRQAQDVSIGRENRRHAQMMRLRMTAESLRRLARSVARERYVTTPADLEIMKNLHQDGVLKEMGEIALALFYQLQAPGTGEDGVDPDERARGALMRLKEIFGLHSDYPPPVRVAPGFSPPQQSPETGDRGPTAAEAAPELSPPYAGLKVGATEVHADPSPLTGLAPNGVKGHAPKAGASREANPYPSITEAEWAARERPRQLLENILTREVEFCETQRQAILKESLTGPSPYERAAEIAPTHANSPLMRRMQDSYFREVRRITNLLLKIKRQERSMETSKKPAFRSDAKGKHKLPFSADYVDDNKDN